MRGPAGEVAGTAMAGHWMRWGDVWDALRVGVRNERRKRGDGARVVSAMGRSGDGPQNAQNVIHLERPTPRLKQARAGASTSLPSPTATLIGAGSLETACSVPSDTALVVDSAASAHRKRSFVWSASS